MDRLGEAGPKIQAEKTIDYEGEGGLWGEKDAKETPPWLYQVAVEKGRQPAGDPCPLSRLRAGAPAKASSGLAESKQPLGG